MLPSSILIPLAGLIPLSAAGDSAAGDSAAGYILQDDYSVDKFFSMFEFFTSVMRFLSMNSRKSGTVFSQDAKSRKQDRDPTNGYVTYVGQSAAQAAGLVNTNNNAVYMGVDYTNIASAPGRQSVRLTSKKSYTHGLIILDLAHMPGGLCGTWPAFWTVGPNWPKGGEIDIIEGVNSQLSNSMALHTVQGCSISNNGLFSGTISTPNCDVNAPGQPNNAGCQILMSNSASYGTGFNQGQGGVYATEWTSDHISIWFFPRGATPADIYSASPEPGNWGPPAASFAGGCDIDSLFSSHQIVFDTTFCGDWAANVWSTDPVCNAKAPTCEAFVQNNPAAFKDAFWSVNSLKVFQSAEGGSIPPHTNPSHVPSAPTVGQSVPAMSFHATSGPNGQPSGFPYSAPADSEVPPSTGFSRGGNGRFTKTWGGGSWDEKTNIDAGFRSAITSAAQVGDSDGATDENVHYVTVTALTLEDFPTREDVPVGQGDDSNVNNKREVVVEKKEIPLSPVELGAPVEARTSKRETKSDMEKRVADKADHLHLHRRGRRHSLFGGLTGAGTTEEKM
ncbi:endo-1,3(4)-beta-glucanase [Exophiala aquamarina CBS 119918]|uniref:endo-1,3(4)-beta-glucanase n=1 Tax=Exophiala aquamarina CBS 119918 TaxID=1182545 RepID=A0A072PUT2_9EURO|nr:endo-1,3(4)-beta-glucanase [Exophiala aquamarina CBS 119918]KEF63819.1 endo-1,3(4)-beta-glucanase [Exophiala aquamarina CBS 119918]